MRVLKFESFFLFQHIDDSLSLFYSYRIAEGKNPRQMVLYASFKIWNFISFSTKRLLSKLILFIYEGKIYGYIWGFYLYMGTIWGKILITSFFLLFFLFLLIVQQYEIKIASDQLFCCTALLLLNIPFLRSFTERKESS